VIDARESEQVRAGTLPGARNVPRSLVLEGKNVGEIKRAKDDGRLPMEDHNTRLIVVGNETAAVRYVAEAIAHEAFHNVAYFAGSVAEANAMVRP
jgi:rhodanese-related sulfurtransferase